MKKVKSPSSLLTKLQGISNEDEIFEMIREHYKDVLDSNEELRFSAESARAFSTLKNLTKYHIFEKRMGQW